MGFGKNSLIIALAPILSGILFLLLYSSGVDIKICKTAFVLTWVAIWWITEAVHLAVASLVAISIISVIRNNGYARNCQRIYRSGNISYL
jgi:di/tricarboxylate transporter